MTIAEYLETVPTSPAIYKDCEITDINVISARYALITLNIPQPIGGTHEEIVPLDTIIETKSD